MTFLKTCSKCRVPQPLANYYKTKQLADGLYSYCKECHKAAVRASYQARARIKPKHRHAPAETLTGLGLRWGTGASIGAKPKRWFPKLHQVWDAEAA